MDSRLITVIKVDVGLVKRETNLVKYNKLWLWKRYKDNEEAIKLIKEIIN